MNKYENGIISVYRKGDAVVVFPRWSKETQHRAHAQIFKYEVDSIYRGCLSEYVCSVKLPLALY